MAATRKYLIQGKNAPFNFWAWAWDHAEEGRNLLPSREPPHDCALGRLLSKDGKVVKPPGSFRRPFFCLCYPTDAPRLPSGTLKNKIAPQSTRALCLGYIGGRSGSFETVGTAHTQAGYAYYLPSENRIGTATSDISFVPSCFPGLVRTSRGGWAIPDDSIPFLRDSVPASDSVPAGDEQTTTHDTTVDISNETDLDMMQHPQGEATLELTRGFPPEQTPSDAAEPQAGGGGEDDAPGRGGPDAAADAAPTPTPTSPPPARYLVPREHWPDYECNEHNGRGWEVVVIERKGEWARCKFMNARDEAGHSYGNEWRRSADLIPLGEHEVSEAVQQQAPAEKEAPPPPPTPSTSEASRTTSRLPLKPTPLPPTTFHSEPLPNQETQTSSGSGDAIRDPVRAERARRPPERLAYAAAAMTAAYVDCSRANFDIQSPRMPDAAFHVDLSHGSDRLVANAFELCDQRGEILMLADEVELRSTFDESPPELQRALMIATDADMVSLEFGATSPQTKLVRELYAVAAYDAASHGVTVPYLDPLVLVTGGEHVGLVAKPHEIFDEMYSGSLLQSGDSMLGNELFALSKAKSSPDIFSERQMRGPEWDTPKQLEVAKIVRLGAKTDVAADDPSIKGMQICEMLWTGRRKRNADGSVLKDNARCVARGDLDKGKFDLTSNDTTSPVARGPL